MVSINPVLLTNKSPSYSEPGGDLPEKWKLQASFSLSYFSKPSWIHCEDTKTSQNMLSMALFEF